MDRVSRILLAIVGAVGLLLGVAGLLYNAASLHGMLQFRTVPSSAAHGPYLYPAYGVMSAICVACYAAMIVSCLRLLRGHLRWAAVLKKVFIAEIIYFMVVTAFWLIPMIGTQFAEDIGSSVAGATGVAGGGLSLQMLTLYPLWAWIALWQVEKRNAVVPTPDPTCGQREP